MQNLSCVYTKIIVAFLLKADCQTAKFLKCTGKISAFTVKALNG